MVKIVLYKAYCITVAESVVGEAGGAAAADAASCDADATGSAPAPP